MKPDLFARGSEPPRAAQFDPELHEAPRFVAQRIVKAPTLGARQRIWDAVPHVWREWIAYDVGLLLGGTIATLPTLAERRAALAEVPEALVAAVQEEVRRVFCMRAARNRSSSA